LAKTGRGAGQSRIRTVGLVGGLGPGATIHYYERLTKEFAKRGTALRLLISHADMYGRLDGFEVAELAPDALDFVHLNYMKIAAAGTVAGSGAGIEGLRAIAQDSARDQGACRIQPDRRPEQAAEGPCLNALPATSSPGLAVDR
jgi:hypothetical protein